MLQTYTNSFQYTGNLHLSFADSASEIDEYFT